MTRDQAMGVLDTVLALARADDTAAALACESRAVTRFADNRITQNLAKDTVSLSVACAYGRQHGAASTTDLSRDGLEAAVERAQAIARVSPADPEYMPPVPASESAAYLAVDGYSAATAEADVLDTCQSVARAAERVAGRGLRLSGAVRTDTHATALANSAGLRAWHEATEADVHATVLTASGSGWAEQIATDASEIRLDDVVDRAREIAEASEAPSAIEPGRCTLILHPAAVGELVGEMFIGFDAKATDEERTHLRGKLGKRICGENITLRSDPSDPACPGRPFQGDGLASRRLTWIDGGVAANLCYSRYWAERQGVEPTGWPTNLILDGGDATIDEMIASTQRGLLATRFWYIRDVDPMAPSVTGMTRDGLFRIEDGRVVGPVRHMRFNENIVDVLGRVEALGAPARTGGWTPMLMPALKVRDFNFTSATRF